MSFAFLRNCEPVWGYKSAPITSKRCGRCGVSKPRDDFYLSGRFSSDGEAMTRSRCKTCDSADANARQKAKRRA